LIRKLIPEAFASEECSFNHRSGEFIGRNGHRARIIFGRHGSPSEVNAFFARGDAAGPDDARRLLESHAHSLPEMRRNFRRATQALRQNSAAWVGAEARDESIRRLGGIDGFMRETREIEQSLHRMGLSRSQVEDAMLTLLDPGTLALYNHVRLTGRAPEFRGLDNARDYAERERGEIAERVRRELLSERQREAIDANLPLETIQRLGEAFRLSASDPAKAADALDRLWREPPNTLTDAQSAALLRVAIATRSEAEGRGEGQRTRDAADTRRSQAMADALHEQMTQRGSGLYHVGSFHRAGLIPRLIANCQSQGGASSGGGVPAVRGRGAN
jgi:hypothetical protein